MNVMFVANKFLSLSLSLKQSGVDTGQHGWSVGRARRGVPYSWSRVWGYNLKLISTLHNDSIPETPSGKKWGGRVHPVHHVATPWMEAIGVLITSSKLMRCTATVGLLQRRTLEGAQRVHISDMWIFTAFREMVPR